MGPALFGAPRFLGPRGPLREICSLLHTRVGIRIEVPEANSEMGSIFLHLLYRNFIRRKRAKFFNMSGYLLLRESQFQIVNFFEVISFKLFLFLHIKVVERPVLAHLHISFLYFGKHKTCFKAY